MNYEQMAASLRRELECGRMPSVFIPGPGWMEVRPETLALVLDAARENFRLVAMRGSLQAAAERVYGETL